MKFVIHYLLKIHYTLNAMLMSNCYKLSLRIFRKIFEHLWRFPYFWRQEEWYTPLSVVKIYKLILIESQRAPVDHKKR